MFAYCNNNPVIYRDSSGTWPEYICDNPATEVGRQLGEWLFEIFNTDRNETDEDGQLTLNAKLKRTGESILYHTDASVSIGMGFHVGVDLGYETEASLGMYGTNATLSYDNGKFFIGQEYYSGAALSVAGFELISFEQEDFRYVDGDGSIGPWAQDERFNNSWAVAGASGYFGVGGSVYLGFNLGGFLEDFDRIWRR